MKKIEWSSQFEIGNETIDSEHRELFSIVTRLWRLVDYKSAAPEKPDELVDELMQYCQQHFEDEERIMQEAGVDDRHLRLQKMEHSSFTYDMQRLRNTGPDETAHERINRLATVASAWLIFHTLRLDQQLGVQLEAIEEGKSPEEAFDLASRSDAGSTANRKVVEALICLWTEAAGRAQELEEQNHALRAWTAVDSLSECA